MNTSIKELELKLQETSNSTKKVDILNKLSKQVRYSDIDRSLKLSSEASELAQSIDYKSGLILSYINTGECYRRVSEFDKALEIYKKAMELCDCLKDLRSKGRIFNLIGIVYSDLNENNEALNYYNKAFDIFVEIDDKESKAQVLQNFGIIYAQLGDYPKALEFFMKSMQSLFECGSGIGENLLNNIGNVYGFLEDYPTALEYFNKALKIAKKNNNKLFYGMSLGNIAQIYCTMKDFDSSLKYSNEYLQIMREGRFRQKEANALTILGKTYMEMNNYEKALEAENQVLAICEEITDYSLKTESLKYIGEIYASKSDFDLAEKYYLQSLDLAQKILYEAIQTELFQKLGMLYLSNNKKSKALKYFYSALELAEKRNAQKDLLGIHKILHEEYKKEGDTAKSLEHLERSNSIEMELVNIESDKKLRTLSIQHEMQSAENEKKMALQEKEIFRLKNVELAKLNEDLKDLNEEKSEFLNITAHDLKNPLSGISSLSRRIRGNIDLMSKDEIANYSKQIENASRNMFELVGKILDINAIESGKRNFKTELFDPSVLMGVVMFDYRPRALAKNIEIVYNQENMSKVLLDKLAVRQILDNLVSNAVKFSPKGKKVYLSAQFREGKVRYEVKDEGPGLTESDKSKLFCKFTRLTAEPTGDENSTGLGLFITKRLTEAMNGKIWCESDEGRGATFIVEFPVNIEPNT
jgi:signal transduction histidine kinase